MYANNTDTGTYNIAITNPLLLGNGTLGVNGIKVRGCYLYFTNTAPNLIANVGIELAIGTTKGASTMLAQSPSGTQYDIFYPGSQGNAYVAVRSGNEVSMISAAKCVQRIIFGTVKGTAFVQPTSISSSKGQRQDNWAYVTTGVGRLLGVDTWKQWRPFGWKQSTARSHGIGEGKLVVIW